MEHSLEHIHDPELDDGEVERVLGPDGQADPGRDPKLEADMLRRLYEGMVRTRLVDERMIALQRQGRVGFHVGSRGEEACVVASAAALGDDNWIFPCYREVGALLWRDYPLQRFVDNMYGNGDDTAKGRQMPDHYTARAFKYASISSPVGTQITHAVGFAWAAKLRGDPGVVGVYFGEGATSSADFHTGMNFAGVYKTPTVLLCRNNSWAISLPANQQTASAGFASKAVAYGIPGVRCDGNDALAVFGAVRDATERAKRGEGSTLVEMVTYRLGGHSTSDDPKAYRTVDEVEKWARLDPVSRLRQHLVVTGAWDDKRESRLRTRVEAEISNAVEAAEAKAPPPLESLFEDVYEQVPWHLRAQQAELLDGTRAKKGH